MKNKKNYWVLATYILGAAFLLLVVINTIQENQKNQLVTFQDFKIPVAVLEHSFELNKDARQFQVCDFKNCMLLRKLN